MCCCELPLYFLLPLSGYASVTVIVHVRIVCYSLTRRGNQKINLNFVVITGILASSGIYCHLINPYSLLSPIVEMSWITITPQIILCNIKTKSKIFHDKHVCIQILHVDVMSRRPQVILHLCSPFIFIPCIYLHKN